MRRANRRSVLHILICVLALILAILIGLLVYLSHRETVPTLSTAPTKTPLQATEAPPTAAPTTAPTTVPPTQETTEPEPQIQYYTLSFAGDCTMANRKGKDGASTFIGTVGDNYDYPFADVLSYFANDDCTFINLENPLTDGGTPETRKTFVFKGPTRYTNILTAGSVEFANIVNNHTLDYGEEGYADTLKALNDAGIYYAEKEKTVLFTTESGLTIGVYADIDPKNGNGIAEKIKQLRKDGAEVVIASFHWGIEYYYRIHGTQQKVAQAAIDAGADIVYGHHPHVLQKVDTYKDRYIFYSLGNFSFGGNGNPPDKDTAIIQVQIVRELDGSVHLGELTLIPCFVSGAGSFGNDYQPCPMDPELDADLYARVLKKLNGTYPVKNLVVDYREDLNPPKPTDPTDSTNPGEGGGSGETTPPTEGGGSGETPPPGGEGGSGETPPPGGDGGSGETPPSGGDGGSGEAPPSGGDGGSGEAPPSGGAGGSGDSGEGGTA